MSNNAGDYERFRLPSEDVQPRKIPALDPGLLHTGDQPSATSFISFQCLDFALSNQRHPRNIGKVMETKFRASFNADFKTT